MPTNADLQREREGASFSVERITNMIDGGKAETDRRRHLERIISQDPTGIFSNDDNPYLHRTERHTRALAKHVRLVELARKMNLGKDTNGELVLDKDFATLAMAISDDLPVMLHWVMFVPNIISLCDEQQKAEWLPLCRDWRMIGCYAQTELGHGSNVRALETTATFRSQADGGMPGGSWVINSPTLTSTKFWPGTLGRTANHAMVIARLIDGDGVDQGVHNFLVPLRSMKNHKLLPGVTTGDIGPKLGLNNMDNGFAKFDNVVIPRRNMAMRFSSVDKNGKYSKKRVSDATSKIAYITMMLVRSQITNEASKHLAVACTIATRYSAVRRQGFKPDSKNKTEMQVLDYKQQQHRIFPLLAASYCFFFTGKKLLQRLLTTEARVTNDEGVTKAEMADLHASTSSLKAYTTSVTADGIEECRKACGGHGFLQSSGLPELATTYLQNPTVEGDNHMLPQQVVKVLLKMVQAVQSGEDLSAYDRCDSKLLIPTLRSMMDSKAVKCTAKSQQDMLDLSLLKEAFGHRAARLLAEVAQQIQTLVMNGKSMGDAWNESLIQMARVSRSYSQLLIVHNMIEGIADESAAGSLGPAEVTVMHNLCRCAALAWIEKDIGDFLEDGYFGVRHAGWVRSSVLQLLSTLRPDAVALVDARDFSDFSLKSALGRYDGDVYPAILEASRRDPLNKTDPGPGYEPNIRRLVKDGVGVYTGTASRL